MRFVRISVISSPYGVFVFANDYSVFLLTWFHNYFKLEHSNFAALGAGNSKTNGYYSGILTVP